MTRKSILAVCIFLSACASVQEKSRPMDEMHGGCGQYDMDLKSELSLWDREPVPLSSGAAAPLSKKLALKLSPQNDVAYVVRPEKAFRKDASFGGVFPVRPESDGALRISAGSKIWFDLVDIRSKEAIEASEFEMQTDCDKIFKVVVFPVRRGTDYILQVSSGADPEAAFLVTPSSGGKKE